MERKNGIKIVAIVFAVLLLAIVGVNMSGAWFASSNVSQSIISVPNVSVDIYYGTEILDGSTISLDSPEDISIKASSSFNITNAYLRAKIFLNCYDSSGNILANYDPADYVEITTSNFESVSGYQEGFLYYHSNGNFNLLNATDAVTLLDASDITKIAEAPAGVSIKMTVFAETIQKDDTGSGLAKWRA